MVIVHQIGWVDHADEGHIMDIIRLPLVCVGHVTSSCEWDAVHKQEHFEEERNSIKGMFAISDVSFATREPDACSVNLKMSQHEVNTTADDPTLYDTFLCGLHQNNMVTRETMKDIQSMTLVRGSHALCGLLHTGNYYVRMILGVEPFLRKHTKVLRTEPGRWTESPRFVHHSGETFTLILGFTWTLNPFPGSPFFLK